MMGYMDTYDEAVIRQQAASDRVTHFAVGIAVRKDDTVLVVRRALHDDFMAGIWELPGGGVDAGETLDQAAARELQEETGLVTTRIINIFEGFDYQTPTKPKVRQVNFLVEVAPGDIQLSPDEHDEYRWIKKGEIDSLNASDEMRRSLQLALR
jgi:8-oxo-dGTP diphosphatase